MWRLWGVLNGMLNIAWLVGRNIIPCMWLVGCYGTQNLVFEMWVASTKDV